MTTIYTDGSCIKTDIRASTGFGGWGFVVIAPKDGSHISFSGGEENTTHNRMELIAVIEAIAYVSKLQTDSNNLTIYSDSKYVIECAKGNWKRNKNTDLWEQFNNVSRGKSITWNWVKGHSGDTYNSIADSICNDYARNLLRKSREAA